MLSGTEILKQIKEGNIIISDFSEDRLNPNSYNIRLGKKLKVYESVVNISQESISKEVERLLEPYKKEYVELTRDPLNNNKKMNEFFNKFNDVKEDVYNTVLRKYALDYKKENKTIDIEIPEDGYVLMPGTLYLGETEEYTETYGFVPNIDGRSTIGRLGIEVHRTAGFGDNGFRGKWTLEITVTHPVIVYPGMEIGQLYYETIEGDTSMMYHGKYQDQKGVQAAKVDKKKD